MRPHGARIRGLLVLTSISAALLAGVLTAGPAFAVANLAANPSTVAPGGTTTITGGGFTGNQSVTITFDNPATTLATVTSDAAGNLPSTVVTVPAGASAGSHTISANCGTCAVGSNTASTVITVSSSAASITVTPSNPTAGQSISVSGTGFNPNSTVTITSNGDYSTGTATATSGGAFGPVTLTDITPAASGQSTITATDNGNPSRSASQTITVGGSGTCTGATLTISPTSVAPGQQVTLSGTGYNPNQTVTFREDNVATGITTNSGTGSWTYTAIASNVSGSHTVTATDTGNRCGQASYTVTGNSTANCPSGYYYNGSSCVLNNGSATCPAGYTQNGVQCVPCTTGSYPYSQQYPYSQPNPYSQQYPYGQQYPYNYGGCTGAPTTCPPGYIYNGYACATAVPTPPVTVAPPAPQVLGSTSSRVPFTGNHTVRMVALALSLLIGGLLLLSARTVVGNRKA